MQTSTGDNQAGSNWNRTRQYFNSLCRRSPSNHHKLEYAVKASHWISLKTLQTLPHCVGGEGRFPELILEKRIAPLWWEGVAWSAKSDKNSGLACSSCEGLGPVPGDLFKYWALDAALFIVYVYSLRFRSNFWSFLRNWRPTYPIALLRVSIKTQKKFLLLRNQSALDSLYGGFSFFKISLFD